MENSNVTYFNSCLYFVDMRRDVRAAGIAAARTAILDERRRSVALRALTAQRIANAYRRVLRRGLRHDLCRDLCRIRSMEPIMCGVCFVRRVTCAIIQCGHCFCDECLIENNRHGRDCPKCRGNSRRAIHIYY